MSTILIVDDRPTNRELLMTLLGYGGHRLMEAGDGAEALALMRAERPDLVITDILMPTMDGFEFVQQLRADPALAATPVVFYTATYRAQEARILAQACGVEHVLCVEDDPAVREVVRLMLKKDGHAVTAADGGQAGLDAFRAAREQGEPFDVVITDLGMPYVDGGEVARTVKRESPDTPVVLLSGWGRGVLSRQEIPAEMDVVLGKPPELRDLRRALRQVCAKRGDSYGDQAL
jgi:CheY-like chemotaxis protein